MTRPRGNATPERVSDIEINRVYEVVCGDCGVIDAPRAYRKAIQARREHWFSAHKAADRG